MGAGGDILLALKTLLRCIPPCALALSGCIDFVEPDLAEAGAPAVLQTNIFLDDRGTLTAGASLVPSLTDDGLERIIRDDTLRISGLQLKPVNRKRNGTLEYSFTTTLADPAGFVRPLSVQSPVISGVNAQPVHIAWFALQTADSDTVVASAGQDVLLHLQLEPGRSEPAPNQRLWLLDLVTDSSSFRISSQGQPPAQLRVPAYWIPPSSNGQVTAYLTYSLSGTYRPAPGDYIHIITANLRIRWNIRLVK